MNHDLLGIVVRSLTIVAGLMLSGTPLFAQSLGSSRFIPNPVPSAGTRITIPDPSRGQGMGQFGAPRTGGRIHNGADLTADARTPVQTIERVRVSRNERLSENEPVRPDLTDDSVSVVPRQPGVSSPTAGLRWPR